MMTNNTIETEAQPDPYAEITQSVGPPYAVQKLITGRNIKFNKAWLARFMIEKHQLRYSRRDRLFRLGPEPSRVVSRVQLTAMIASDFRDYLKNYHEDAASVVFSQMNEAVCRGVLRLILAYIQDGNPSHYRRPW